MSTQKSNFAIYSAIQNKDAKSKAVNILDIILKNKEEEIRQKRIKFIYLIGSSVLIIFLTILII